MADIQAELAQTQEHNRKLYADIDMLKTDYEKTQFKEMIAQLQKELMSAKLKLDQKDLKLQNYEYKMKDAVSRRDELEQKCIHYDQKIERLNTEVSTLTEQLHLGNTPRVASSVYVTPGGGPAQVE